MFRIGDIVRVKQSHSEEWLRGVILELTHCLPRRPWSYYGICLDHNNSPYSEDGYADVGDVYCFPEESLELYGVEQTDQTG